MKKLLIVLFVLIPFCSFSQTGEKLQFSLIDSIAGTKADLFSYAKSWLAKTFVSAKSVIEMEDKEAGTIVGNGIFTSRVNSVFGNQVGLDIISFEITIDTKDNKYRTVLSNFKHRYLQQASTYIPGQPLASAVGNSMNRNGGALENEKPDCPGINLTKKQWAKIKDFVSVESKATLESLKNYMQNAKSNKDF